MIIILIIIVVVIITIAIIIISMNIIGIVIVVIVITMLFSPKALHNPFSQFPSASDKSPHRCLHISDVVVSCISTLSPITHLTLKHSQ